MCVNNMKQFKAGTAHADDVAPSASPGAIPCSQPREVLGAPPGTDTVLPPSLECPSLECITVEGDGEDFCEQVRQWMHGTPDGASEDQQEQRLQENLSQEALADIGKKIDSTRADTCTPQQRMLEKKAVMLSQAVAHYSLKLFYFLNMFGKVLSF